MNQRDYADDWDGNWPDDQKSFVTKTCIIVWFPYQHDAPACLSNFQNYWEREREKNNISYDDALAAYNGKMYMHITQRPSVVVKFSTPEDLTYFIMKWT